MLGPLRLFYHETGAGTPVLFIPGMSGDHSAFLGQYAALRQRFRCLGVDPRGAGRSDVPPGPYTGLTMAEDLIRLLDHLGISECHVVGHSLGGRVAQIMALHFPQRVRKLVLMGTGARLDPWQQAVVESWVEMRRHLPDEAWVRGIAVWMFSPATYARPGWIDRYVRGSLRVPLQSLEGMEAQAAAVLGHNVLAEAGGITASTLVLVGEDDFALGPARELAAAIPGARLQVVPQAGHILHVEQSAAVNAAIAGFLSE